jgi:6-phosphogluconolactonase
MPDLFAVGTHRTGLRFSGTGPVAEEAGGQGIHHAEAKVLSWVKATIQVESDPAAVAVRALQWVIDCLAGGAKGEEPLSLVLSGGSTPRQLYRLLAGPAARGRIPWDRLHIFWADERAVPPDDPQSNYRLAVELALGHLPIAERNIHRIRGEAGAKRAARDYEKVLSSFARNDSRWLRPDLVLLGLGEDGHVASLFPGSAALGNRHQAAVAVRADYLGRPADRITLTPALLNGARHILFLVTGRAKREAVRRALSSPLDPLQVPAHALQPVDGEVTWLLDRAAAG